MKLIVNNHVLDVPKDCDLLVIDANNDRIDANYYRKDSGIMIGLSCDLA